MKAPRGVEFLVTCEHGGNRIPAPWRACFVGTGNLLKSHRGHDPGALIMARALARRLDAPMFYSTVSRLLVDLNRSPGHPRLHGECIRALPVAQRQRIIERHYLPYRRRVADAVVAAQAAGRSVIHVSSHSFTPVLDGEIRNADIGLLYDPARPAEAALCRAWQAALEARAPDLRVRRNYPYTGKSDGLTAWLRRRYAGDAYLGIELEINQAIVLAGGAPWRRLRADLLASLGEALAAVAFTAAFAVAPG